MRFTRKLEADSIGETNFEEVKNYFSGKKYSTSKYNGLCQRWCRWYDWHVQMIYILFKKCGAWSFSHTMRGQISPFDGLKQKFERTSAWYSCYCYKSCQLQEIRFTSRSSFPAALWGKWWRFYKATFAYRGSMIIIGQMSSPFCYTLRRSCINSKWQIAWRTGSCCDGFFHLSDIYFIEFVEQTVSMTNL